MSTLAELTAVGWDREIAGQTWHFSPLTLADWALLEQRVVAERPDALALAKAHLDGLSPTAQRELLEAALVESTRRRQASLAELLEYADSPAGLALSVWLSLRRGHPELTEAEAASLVERMAAAEHEDLEAELDRLRGLLENPPKN